METSLTLKSSVDTTCGAFYFFMSQVLYFGKEPKRSPYNVTHRREIHVMLPEGYHKVTSGIYRLWFDDRFYIGRAENIRTRVRDHAKKIEYAFHINKPEGWFYATVLSFLKANPTFSVIKVEVLEGCNIHELHSKESEWLLKLSADKKCMNVCKTASRTAKDKSRSEFKEGVYAIEFKISNMAEYFAFKKLTKQHNVISNSFIK